MSTPPEPDGKRTALATGAILLLPVSCCGLPLLIAAGALGAVGSVVGNPWVIGAAAALGLAVVVRRVLRRASRSSEDDSACCPPDPPSAQSSRHTRRSTNQES